MTDFDASLQAAGLIYRMAQILGIPIVSCKFPGRRLLSPNFHDSHDSDPVWDGARLLVTPDSTATQVLHEVAHFIVATDAERGALDFDLTVMEKSENIQREEQADRVQNALQACIQALLEAAAASTVPRRRTQ